MLPRGLTLTITYRQAFVLVTQEEKLNHLFLNQLKEFTCNGVAVSQVANCVLDGRLCSNAGVCTDNQCLCNSGREGQYCENSISASSDNTLPIALGKLVGLCCYIVMLRREPHMPFVRVHTGIALPSVGVVLLLLAVLIVVLLVVIKRKGNKSDDWEINYEELEIGEQLGAGGYVHVPARAPVCE
jgi:hypothetical protein